MPLVFIPCTIESSFKKTKNPYKIILNSMSVHQNLTIKKINVYLNSQDAIDRLIAIWHFPLGYPIV